MILSCIRLIKAFVRKLSDDCISAFAAQATYYIILSFFPFVIFLLTILRYLPIFSEGLPDISVSIIPETLVPFMETILNELKKASSGTVVSVAVIATLWSSSRGILSLTRGLNAAYGHKETRNYFMLRFICILYTFALAILLILSLLLLVFGNQLYILIIHKFPLLGDLALLLMSIRSITTLFIFSLFFVLLYKLLPNGKTRILQTLPGAIFSSACWLLFSFLFSYYIDNMGNYSYMYGSLTAIIVSMLWLYFCLYIFFIGAEINVILAHPSVHNASRAYLAYRTQRKKHSLKNKHTDD